MRCLVTGATGFLGTNLVRALVAEGWQVRAFGLPGSETRDLPQQAEVVFGDVTRPDDVDAAVRGMDVVFHVAGDTSFWRRRFARQRAVNVDGAALVAESCLRHGVRRLVHTSTVDALGYDPAGPADETWPHYNYGGTGYHYADTKREGERRVRACIDRGLDVVVIYPGSILGPFDFTLQYGRLFFDLRDGKVPACPSGGAPFAHVVEVARAHVAAATRGQSGEGYICAGVNAPYRALFQAIAERFGRAAPRLTLPQWALVPYARALEVSSFFTGAPPEVDPGMARYLSVNAYYDCSKAVRTLGYRVVPLARMVEDAHAWYRDNGFL
jgi:dihydroflavonol-4-reductase